jgi:toxin ParE1/3/4
MMNELFEIAWSNKAGKDLENIKLYLTENGSEQTALKVLKGIFNAVHTLSEQPERYPLHTRFKKFGNYRYINKWSYKVIYEFTGHQVIIHRVSHVKKNPSRIRL